MQVSIESSEGLERKLKVQLPAERVDREVMQRLEKATKTVSIKGFRKGKVPVRVVKQQYGKGVRQEVVGELINSSLIEAIQQQDLRLVGQPRIDGLLDQEGAELEFLAIFEVYPELNLSDFSNLEIERPLAEVLDEDIDRMLNSLREQKATFESVERAAVDGDQLVIDYVGTKGGEEFAGGNAEDQSLLLGSNSMIPGFEDGLVGASQSDEVTLELSFPEDYHSEDLKGAAVEFQVTVKDVQAKNLPELNDELFTEFGVDEGGLDKFREEVEGNLQRELGIALRSKIKNRVMEQLFAHNSVELPEALIANETTQLKQQMVQQFGGGQQIDLNMLPDQMFRGKAKYRAALGVIVSEVVRVEELVAGAEAVRARIDEIAKTYDDPQQVVDYYYSNQEMLKSVEAVVLEDLVVEAVLAKASVTDQSLGYQDAVKPDPEPDYGESNEAVESETGDAK
jgi:trigger factor